MIPLFVLCMYFRLSIYIQTSSSSTPSTRHRHTDTFFFLPPRGAALLSPPPAFAVPIFSVPSFPSSRRPSVKRSDSEARLFFFSGGDRRTVARVQGQKCMGGPVQEYICCMSAVFGCLFPAAQSVGWHQRAPKGRTGRRRVTAAAVSFHGLPPAPSLPHFA